MVHFTAAVDPESSVQEEDLEVGRHGRPAEESAGVEEAG